MLFRILVAFAMLGLYSCKSTQLVGHLQPQELKAVDIEEELSGQDELLLAYTLTTFDAAGKPTNSITGTWGVQAVRKGQVIPLKAFKPIEVPVPAKGRLVASLVLLEIEDYNKAQQFLEGLRKANAVAGIPSVVLDAGEAATPLRYLSWAIMAAGVSVKGVKYFDGDDVLGQHEFVLKASDLKSDQQLHRVPVVFKDKNYTDSYHYEINYELTFKTIRQR